MYVRKTKRKKFYQKLYVFRRFPHKLIFFKPPCNISAILSYTSQKQIIFFTEIEELRPKRDGMVGLFPFPRVGRSDPDLIQEWDGSDFSLNSNEDYGGDD